MKEFTANFTEIIIEIIERLLIKSINYKAKFDFFFANKNYKKWEFIITFEYSQ